MRFRRRLRGLGWVLGLSWALAAPSVGAQSSRPASPPTHPPPSSPEAQALAEKQKVLQDLMNRYAQLVDRANRATSYEEKKRYIEEADRLRPQMAQAHQEVQKAWQAYQEKARAQGPSPSALSAEADRLLAQIRELEAQIQRRVEDINAQIAKAEKEGDPVLQERAKKQIQRLIDELNELKKRHRELAGHYERLTEKATEAPPPPPKDEKAKPPPP